MSKVRTCCTPKHLGGRTGQADVQRVGTAGERYRLGLRQFEIYRGIGGLLSARAAAAVRSVRRAEVARETKSERNRCIAGFPFRPPTRRRPIVLSASLASTIIKSHARAIFDGVDEVPPYEVACLELDARLGFSGHRPLPTVPVRHPLGRPAGGTTGPLRLGQWFGQAVAAYWQFCHGVDGDGALSQTVRHEAASPTTTKSGGVPRMRGIGWNVSGSPVTARYTQLPAGAAATRNAIT